MRRCLVFLLAVCWVWPSAAQLTVKITKADCDRLIQHIPDPDVEYRPGVDVRGRPVVSANLDSGVQIEAPRDFYIEIDVDLQERFGLPANPEQYEADAKIGIVTVRGDEFFFNGQPLRDEEQAALTAACQRIRRGD